MKVDMSSVSSFQFVLMYTEFMHIMHEIGLPKRVSNEAINTYKSNIGLQIFDIDIPETLRKNFHINPDILRISGISQAMIDREIDLNPHITLKELAIRIYCYTNNRMGLSETYLILEYIMNKLPRGYFAMISPSTQDHQVVVQF